METEKLKYINAVNIIIEAKIGELLLINEQYHGDWERAFYEIQKKHNKTINIKKEWEKITKFGIDIITINEKEYPISLKQIYDPPYLLYIRRNKELFDSKNVAVVGTRRMSLYGKQVTLDIVSSLARADLAIYSGLAFGIDALAHKTALDCNGKTIAVLANGLDDESIHPRSNISLAREIIQKNGMLVSEYAPGYQARAYSFPQRNRIMSGLSQSVLVIEGSIKSG